MPWIILDVWLGELLNGLVDLLWCEKCFKCEVKFALAALEKDLVDNKIKWKHDYTNECYDQGLVVINYRELDCARWGDHFLNDGVYRP